MVRRTTTARRSKVYPTWPELVAREPRLADLRREIEAMPRPQPGEPYCANAAWYHPLVRQVPLPLRWPPKPSGESSRLRFLEANVYTARELRDMKLPPTKTIDGSVARLHSLKERMHRLVGWERKDDPVLGTAEAYEVAYDTLYHLLPDCQHDGSECWG